MKVKVSGKVKTFTFLIATYWMWNSNKFDDSWTIKLAVFVVSLNSEGKSMCSDQYLKSCGWTRSLSTLFASFHFIHSQLFVGSFQIRFRWNIFVPSCSFSYKNANYKRNHGGLVFRRKKIVFIDAIFLSWNQTKQVYWNWVKFEHRSFSMSPLGAVPCDDSLNMQYFTRFSWQKYDMFLSSYWWTWFQYTWVQVLSTNNYL